MLPDGYRKFPPRSKNAVHRVASVRVKLECALSLFTMSMSVTVACGSCVGKVLSDRNDYRRRELWLSPLSQLPLPTAQTMQRACRHVRQVEIGHRRARGHECRPVNGPTCTCELLLSQQGRSSRPAMSYSLLAETSASCKRMKTMCDLFLMA